MGTASDHGRTPRVADALRGARGPQGLHVPHLALKLELLLVLVGRNQAWLASCLNVTPPAVTNWKREERLPALHGQVACRLLGIDLATLVEPDLERFHSLVDAAYAAGSGRRWATLVRTAIETAEGLLLLIDGEVPRPPPLKAVVFARNPQAPRPQLPEVTLEQRIRFALPDAAVATLPFGPMSFVLCIEDQHGWAALCPTGRARSFVHQGDRWWLPPLDRKALELEPPIGVHRAIAVAVSGALPEAIGTAFHGGKVEWAGDSLAGWIVNEKVPHMVFGRSFSVVAA
jgi:hypothetical protein